MRAACSGRWAARVSIPGPRTCRPAGSRISVPTFATSVSPRVLTLRLLLAASFFLLVGCGGGDSQSSPPPTAPTPAPAPPAPIQTIVEHTGGRVQSGGGIPPLARGQSVIIRQGPFNSLRFSWQRSGTGGTPVSSATGRVYLLSREYLGPVADLSASVDGFIAVSTSVAEDEYVFDAAIAIQAGTYWFYSNDQTATLLSSDGRQDLYSDGEMYVLSVGSRFAVFHTTMQGTDPHDANFVL